MKLKDVITQLQKLVERSYEQVESIITSIRIVQTKIHKLKAKEEVSKPTTNKSTV